MKKKRKSTDRFARHHSRLALASGVLVSVALGGAAHAVVLGGVQVHSNLGQPLVAEVEVLNVDQDSLKARLAPPNVHQAHSFEVPHQLGNVNVRLVNKRDGRHVLRVTSDRAVTEPTLELLLQAEDNTGSIVRYVPLLIDPAPTGGRPTPVMVQDQPATRTVSTPSTSAPFQVSRAPSAGGAEPARSSPARKATRVADAAKKRHQNAPKSAKVQAGQSLDVGRSVSDQAADAPKPRVASVAPGRSDAVSKADLAPVATALVPKTTDAGSSKSESTPQTVAGPGTPGTAGNAEGVARPGTPSPKGNQETGAIAASTPTAGAEAAGLASPSVRSSGGAEVASNTPVIAKTATPAAVEGNGRPGNSDEEGLLGNPLLVGAGALLAGGLLAFGWRRRRRDDRPFGAAIAPPAADAPPTLGGDSRAAATGFSLKSGYPGSKRLPPRGPSVFSTSAFEMMDDVDPVAEADVYIAYGRTDHARAILEDAIRVQPNRAALHLKLLAIHLERRDARAFADQARVLAQLTDAQGPEWQQAVAMGLRLDPENPLYAASSDNGPHGHLVDFDLSSDVQALARDEEQRAKTPVRTKEPPSTLHMEAASTSGSRTPSAEDWRSGGPDQGGSRFNQAPSDEGVALSPSRDDHLIDFDLTEHPPEVRRGVASPHASPTAGRTASAVPTSSIESMPERTGATVQPVQGAVSEAANLSRFDTLPAKLAVIKNLLDGDDRYGAAEAVEDAAQMVAELRSEAFHIMAAALRRA